MATLVNMRTAAVRRANALGYLSLSDSTDKAYVDALLNASLYTLHDLLTAKFQDYQLGDSASDSITQQITSTASPSFAVPPKAYKVRDVEYLGAAGTNPPVSMPRIAWRERNNVLTERCFCVAGSSILIRPSAQSVGLYKTWYTPLYVPLVLDNDVYDAINGWEDIAVIDTAIAIVSDQERDTSDLEKRLAAKIDEVNTAALQRVSGAPSRVRKVKRRLEDSIILADLDPDRYR